MFKFTIRDLLWLTLVVALALGWFVREASFEKKLAGERMEAARWQRAYRSAVPYEDKIVKVIPPAPPDADPSN